MRTISKAIAIAGIFLVLSSSAPLAAQTANADLQNARKLFEAKKFPEALRGFKAVLSQHPSSTEASVASYYVGLSNERLGRLADAVAAYDETIRNYGRSEMAKYAGQRAKEVQARLQKGSPDSSSTPMVLPPAVNPPIKSKGPDKLDAKLNPTKEAREPRETREKPSFPANQSNPAGQANRSWPSAQETPFVPAPVSAVDASGAKFPVQFLNPKSTGVVVPVSGNRATAMPTSGTRASSSSSGTEFPTGWNTASKSEWIELDSGKSQVQSDWVPMADPSPATNTSSAWNSDRPLFDLPLGKRATIGNVPSPSAALGGAFETKKVGGDETAGKSENPVRAISPLDFKIDVPAIKFASYFDLSPARSDIEERVTISEPNPDRPAVNTASSNPSVPSPDVAAQVDAEIKKMNGNNQGILVSGTPDWAPVSVENGSAVSDANASTSDPSNEFTPVPPPVSGIGDLTPIDPSAPIFNATPVAPKLDLSSGGSSNSGIAISSFDLRPPTWSSAPSSTLPAPQSPIMAAPSLGTSLIPQSEIGLDDFRRDLMKESTLNAPSSLAIPTVQSSYNSSPAPFYGQGPSSSGWSDPSFQSAPVASQPVLGTPGDPNVLRAIEFRRSGREDLAIEEYQKAIDLDPSNTVARNNLADIWLSRNERIDEAIALLTQALAYNPQDKGPYYSTLGLAYGMKGEFARAEQFLTEALKIGQSAERLYRRGKVYEGMGLIAKARADYDRALVYAEEPAMIARIREALSAIESTIAR